MRICLCLLLLLCLHGEAHADEALWDRLREGGYAIAIRHARAPGTGDPAGFALDDCSTQRNLSAEGRAQATALGEAFRVRAVPVGRVLSSRWCRALETARLAFGAATPEPALDSLHGRPERRGTQSESMRDIVRAWPKDKGNLVLVTHQANISALTGVFPSEGEMVILVAASDGAISVVGRLKP